ncbi:MAG: substrate-binding domain-containing protein [Pseudomonadota bacterium]
MSKHWVVALWLALAGPAMSDDVLLLQSTTSTQNSGLYEHILPLFERRTGIDVRVVAVGTGQALKNAANCDGDVVIVHSRVHEDGFVARGYGVERRDLMQNDFVVVGPAADPADIRTLLPAPAFARLAQGKSPFISRGDDSGTHAKERALWQLAMADPRGASGSWYREAGAGMGATLNIAIGMDAYTLTDRATWLTFANRGDHRVLVEGGAALANPYGIIPVSAAHCPNINAEGAARFVDWMTGPDGQAAIASFTVNGAQLFSPASD